MSVQLLERVVVIARIEYEAVVRIDDAFFVAVPAVVIDVAFEPFAARGIGQQAIVVIEAAASYAPAREDVP